MDKRFLNKVLDQIVSETRIEFKIRYRREVITSPFFLTLFPFLFRYTPASLSSCPNIFKNHCKNVYGLNDDEVDYVWKKYKDIIKDKIESNR